MLVWFIGSCGTDFNPKKELSGQLAKPIKTSEEVGIKSLPNLPVITLSSADQDKIASMVFDYIYNDFDHLKIAKMACHYRGLYAGNDCSDVRRQCLKEVNKLSNDDIKAHIKSDENKIKDHIKKQVVPPKTFLEVFEVFARGMERAAGIDCDTSDQQRQEEEDQFLSDLKKKYSEPDSKLIKKLLKDLLEYIITF
jgi:hypothetical protein